MDGYVVYASRFYSLDKSYRLAVKYVSRETRNWLWPMILQVLVNSNLAGDSLAWPNPLLGLFDHGGDLVWACHHAATNSFFHCP